MRWCEQKARKHRSNLLRSSPLFSIRMLMRLLDRHQEAVSYVEKVAESILNKAFPAILVDGIKPEALNLSHLLAAIAPRFANIFSMLGPIARICKILNNEVDLAARVLQWRVKVKKKLRELELAKSSIPKERYIRKKMTLNMKTDELNGKWRKMHDSEFGSALPPDVQLAYIKILLALCRPENTKHFTENRIEVVKKHGLFPIGLCLQEVGEEYLDPGGGNVDEATVGTGGTDSVTAVSLGALKVDDGGITKAHQVSKAVSLLSTLTLSNVIDSSSCATRSRG